MVVSEPIALVTFTTRASEEARSSGSTAWNTAGGPKTFTSHARHVLGEEGAHRYARWATAELRSAMGRYPDDGYLRSLHAELSATSADFRSLWAQGEVGVGHSAVKHLFHPTRGWQTFQSEMLHDAERDHWLVIYASVGRPYGVGCGYGSQDRRNRRSALPSPGTPGGTAPAGRLPVSGCRAGPERPRYPGSPPR
ncbi:hypothetical protein ABZ234_32720 [Nocardiopsis sp. NPDC006198]|uniref:MmyB family transcriptional regulator n=1 Tax=Nocardiopsis sp. NPDC006198 TaxID=3154472 RepID=UPI0033B83419